MGPKQIQLHQQWFLGTETAVPVDLMKRRVSPVYTHIDGGAAVLLDARCLIVTKGNVDATRCCVVIVGNPTPSPSLISFCC